MQNHADANHIKSWASWVRRTLTLEEISTTLLVLKHRRHKANTSLGSWETHELKLIPPRTERAAQTGVGGLVLYHRTAAPPSVVVHPAEEKDLYREALTLVAIASVCFSRKDLSEAKVREHYAKGKTRDGRWGWEMAVAHGTLSPFHEGR